MRRKPRPPAQVNAGDPPRHRRNVGPQPVPTFQPGPEAPPPPQPQADAEEEAVVAAVNRMVEAAYT